MSTEPTSLLRLALPPLPKFDLPEIPPITDSELERQVFTHSSFYARPRKATSLDLDDGEKIMDNEKLEHVGDALLGESYLDHSRRRKEQEGEKPRS